MVTLGATRKSWVQRRYWALVASFMALNCLIAPVSGFLHMALVRHVWCAEHGEIEHARGSAHQPQAVRADSTSPLSSETSIAADQGDAAQSDEHHHCVLLSVLRTVAILRGFAERPTLVRPARVEAQKAPTFERADAAFPIYVLAPKHSPPQPAARKLT